MRAVAIYLAIAAVALAQATISEVKLTAPADFVIVVDGKQKGTTQAPAGTTVKVTKIDGEILTCSFAGGSALIPITSTDYAERITAIKLAQRKARVTLDGKALTGVRAVAIDDNGRISVTHSKGITSALPYDVDKEFLDAWGYTRPVLSNRLAQIKIAREKKAAEDKQAADEAAQRLKAKIGPKPYVDETRGSSALKFAMKQLLKDPDSLQFIHCSQPIVVTRNGEPYWAVTLRYRAKNSFGGYNIEEGVALMREQAVVDWEQKDLK